MLTAHSKDLHSVAAPQSMLGLQIGGRMTAIKLGTGDVLLHSPVAFTQALADAVAELGPVSWIVCPNVYHHLHAAPWAARFSSATLVGPRALAKKRRDLELGAYLDDAPGSWSDDLTPVHIDGCMLDETVFVHAASRTVVASDLTENFVDGSPHALTNLYLKAAGIHGKPGWSRFLRFLYRDTRAARRSINALLEHEFDRVIIAHGDVLERDAKDAVRETFRFLG
jgi:hypothetical protein